MDPDGTLKRNKHVLALISLSHRPGTHGRRGLRHGRAALEINGNEVLLEIVHLGGRSIVAQHELGQVVWTGSCTCPGWCCPRQQAPGTSCHVAPPLATCTRSGPTLQASGCLQEAALGEAGAESHHPNDGAAPLFQ